MLFKGWFCNFLRLLKALHMKNNGLSLMSKGSRLSMAGVSNVE
jgi:hypothetical protein